MKTRQQTTGTHGSSVGNRSEANGAFPTHARTQRNRFVLGLLVAALVAAGCNTAPGTDGAAAAELEGDGSPPAAAAQGEATPVPMLTHDDLITATGIVSLSEPRVDEGEDGPLPRTCGVREGADAPFRWWGYNIVPVDGERQPYAEHVWATVLEFESADAAGATFATISEGFASCDEYSHRTLALSRVDLVPVDRADGAFVFTARATTSDEHLHGTEDRQFDRHALGCEVRVWNGRWLSSVSVYMSEDRVDQGGCEAVANAAADRLGA